LPELNRTQGRDRRFKPAHVATHLAMLAMLCGTALAVLTTQASIRLLWFDEFITLYIAKLNSFREIWDALGRGVDPNPPLTHLLVMSSVRLFGESEIAVRLPALVAGLATIVALYVYLARRVPVVYAVIGVVYFMGTAGFDYSYESRSYALMLLFSIGSLLAWRGVCEGRYGNFAAILLAVTLAAGISSNYFAVLAFFPIAAGEATRMLRTRKVAWRVWIAMAVGASPLLVYWPMINYSIAQFSPYAWNRPQLAAIRNAYVQMVAVNLIPALAMLAVAGYTYVRRRRQHQPLTPVLPRHETIAVLTLLVYPFLGYALAVAGAGMVSPRFVLPVCIGFGIATAAGTFHALPESRRVTLALVGLLAISFVVREVAIGIWFYNQRLAVFRVRDRLPEADVIAVSDSLLVLPLHYYSTPRLASRMVFPIDFESIRRWKKSDSPEQNLWAGRDLFPVPTVPLNDFVEQSPNYLIVTTEGNWLIHKLAFDGSPAMPLNVPTDTKPVGGFFPLSHGEVHYFLSGQSVAQSLTPGNSTGAPNQRRKARPESR